MKIIPAHEIKHRGIAAVDGLITRVAAILYDIASHNEVYR